MITFKQFLTEMKNEPITLEQAVKLVKDNCSKFLEMDAPIYRGMSSRGEYVLGDSRQGAERVSAGLKSNLYTRWMDTSPKWEGWPKRGKSYICSTDKDQASHYGDIVYSVFPYDNAVIAKTATRDIWYSFGGDNEPSIAEIQNDITAMLSTGHQFSDIIPFTLAVLNKQIEYSQIAEILKIISIKNMDDFIEDTYQDSYSAELIKVRTSAARIKSILKYNGYDNMFEYFENEVVPDKFQMSNVANADFIVGAPYGEVYIEGKVIFVEEDLAEEFLELVRT